MKRLFGTAKEAGPAKPPPSLHDASAKADGRVTDLEAKIAKCDEDLRRYMAPGRGTANKALAVQTLKRKKMYEQQRDQILGTQFNVDMLAGAQEQAEMTVVAVEAMKAGQADLKQRYKDLGGVADIERLMDDMADLSDEIADINEAMATSYAVPDGFDEASCEAEFAALEEELSMEKLAGIGSASSRPTYLPAPGTVAPPIASAVADPAAPADPEAEGRGGQVLGHGS